jgi:hypothetical protein
MESKGTARGTAGAAGEVEGGRAERRKSIKSVIKRTAAEERERERKRESMVGELLNRIKRGCAIKSFQAFHLARILMRCAPPLLA